MRTKTGLMVAAAVCAGVSACWILLPDTTQPGGERSSADVSATVAGLAQANKPADPSIAAVPTLIAGNPWDEQAVSSTANNSQALMRIAAISKRYVTAQRSLAAVVPNAAVPNLERMSASVAALAQSGSDEMVELVVRHTGQPASGEADRVVELGGQVLRTYQNFPLMAVRVPANQLGEFAGGSSISYLDLNAPVTAASVYARQTANTPGSFTGTTAAPVSSSFAVAVVDSGVSGHSDLNVVSHRVFNDARGSLVSTYYDAFGKNTYAGSDTWSGSDWIERNDSGGSSSGYVRLSSSSCPADYNGYCLELRANGPSNVSVERSMHLLGVSEAFMFFDYNVANVSAAAEFVIEASSDGVNWSAPLARYNTPGSNTAGYSTAINISPYISSETRIRFRATKSDSSARLLIDNIGVWFRSGTYVRDDFDSWNY
ncbi:MAG TPA: hypothetical protein PK159_16355, partial [Steroidobacteraceae bacterium]|nr:hypothetical protein [Steroidobacteraceae bacterium]